jgi:hypothetical protein
LKYFIALLVRHTYEIFLADHVGFLSPDSVNDEAPVILRVRVIRALVADQVTSRNLTGQWKKYFGIQANRGEVALFHQPRAPTPRPETRVRGWASSVDR